MSQILECRPAASQLKILIYLIDYNFVNIVCDYLSYIGMLRNLNAYQEICSWGLRSFVKLQVQVQGPNLELTLLSHSNNNKNNNKNNKKNNSKNKNKNPHLNFLSKWYNGQTRSNF